MRLNTHGLSDNVSCCILRGWRSVLIAPQPEAISDFLRLVLSLQCHSLPPGVYSTVLNITNSLRYSQPHAGHLLASFCSKSLWGRMPWELQPSGLPACELAKPLVLSRVLARSSSQTNYPQGKESCQCPPFLSLPHSLVRASSVISSCAPADHSWGGWWDGSTSVLVLGLGSW